MDKSRIRKLADVVEGSCVGAVAIGKTRDFVSTWRTYTSYVVPPRAFTDGQPSFGPNTYVSTKTDTSGTTPKDILQSVHWTSVTIPISPTTFSYRVT